MVRGVIFDLDLTLLDSRKGIWANFCRAARRCGLREPAYDEVAPTIGLALADAMVELWGECRPSWLEVYRDEFSLSGYRGVVPLPGAFDALAELRHRGLKLAIATNRVSPQGICDAVGVSPLVDGVYGTAGLPHKPAPDLLLAAARGLELKAGDCLYVGDTPIDVESADRAGMECVAVASGLQSKEDLLACGAPAVLDSVADLPDFLRARL